MSGAGANPGKLVVIGVGLIGGSFALATRRAGRFRTVVGVGRSRRNLDAALERGIIDVAFDAGGAWGSETADADLVLVATPVAQMPGAFSVLAGAAGACTVITDAGSTKQDVITAARANLGSKLPDFVPAHPIAGTEHSGAEAAFAELFVNRTVVLCPGADTGAHALERVRAAWTACGAHIELLVPAEHDRAFAAVSHLPHLLAFALVDMLAQRSDHDLFFRFAASGFRDFTRIASSHPEMWRDICIANRDRLRDEIAEYRNALLVLDRALAQGDAGTLEAVFTRARSARSEWLARGEAKRA